MADSQAQLKDDRTPRAITRQLEAMGCDRYEIGIREAGSGRMVNREWSPREVIRNAARLKRLNALGNDIHIRPARDARHGLVLVDDLGSDDLDAMKREGREPALIVETRPERHQAWVKVPEQATDAHRGEIARQLAREYGSAPANADGGHYGRLAGFTNRTDEPTDRGGYQPRVLLGESSGRRAGTGPELVRQAGRRLEARERRRERARRLEGIERPEPVGRHRRSAADEYRREMRGLVERYGDDLGQCDFIAAMKLARNGRDPDDIAKALAEASPALPEHEPGHEADYIKRTVTKVMELPQVQEARAELAEKRCQRSRGRI